MSISNIPGRARQRAAFSLVAALAVALVPAFAGPAVGQPDPAEPDDKGAPETAAPAAPPAPECDLNAGAHERDEFSHCTTIDLTFASTPDLGAGTTVEVALTSVADNSGTLTLLVNDRFAFGGASGFAEAGTKASGAGPMTALSRDVSLTADQTANFTFQVRGERNGIGIVQARYNTAGGAFDGGDEISAQLGQAAPTPETGRRTTTVPAGAPQDDGRGPGMAPYAEAPLKGAQKSLSPSAPNASCVSGGWRFNDENGVSQPSVNFQVQVWDADSPSADDHLATGVTNFSGNYNLCFESSDGEGGGQEVYVRFISANSAWRVRNTAAANDNYIYATGVVNLPDPGSHSFGNLQPANGAEHRALHAFDGINRLWLWHAGINGFLDNPGQNRQMIVNWTPTSTDGTYYSLGGNDIHLAAADPDADHVTIHEGAHALMDAIFNDDYPPFPNCNPHFIFGASSTGCAWTEGWAEWVPARVLNDPFFRFPSGAAVNLESPSWTTNTSAYGDDVEGRVAGALIDLSDHTNEGFWDRFGEGGSSAATEEIYATNLTGVSDTFNEFFNTDRPGEGDTGFFARASVFQNTIDYTHRDPLVSTQQLTRPSLASNPNPHNYSYSAFSSTWGGVAIRPPGGADYDLRLFSDTAQTNTLATSAFGGSTIDYILVDGNHRIGSFFPRAYLFSGSGSYQVEQYTGNDTLGLGLEFESFGSGDVIKPFEAAVNGGQTNYVGVDPGGGLDVELFAHDSDGTFANATQTRSAADAFSSAAGAGGVERLSYSSPDSDWTGLVVLNKGGSGSYTIYRDTAGPSSPTIAIDGGYPTTYDTTVDLDLSASPTNGAGNTPLQEMQISTDGTFDSEPWQAYSTSATTTLPGGFGNRTVWVRYRNAAGAISAVASDLIKRVAIPTCDGLTPTIADTGTVTGTTGDDVIVGGVAADHIFGLGGDDVICGLGGNDTINDGPGGDDVFAGNGNDVMYQPAAPDAGDEFHGGGGVDRVSYQVRSVNVNVTINTTANDGAAGEGDLVSTSVENVTTGTGNDNIVGNGAANRLVAGDGDDTVSGAAGGDKIYGGAGDDTLRGVGGNDTVIGGGGNDTIDEGSTANGADFANGGAGVDKITYLARTGAVAIRLNGVATSGAAGENDKLIGFEEAIGGSGNDTIVGHTAADRLLGNGGNDTVNGNGNADTIIGGPGNDTLSGNGGPDFLNSRDNVNGNDSVHGGAGADSALTDPGDTVVSVP